MNAADQPHYVYEAWMRDVCLYVGMTGNISRRLGEHRRMQAWFKAADRFAVAVYPNRAAAELGEIDRIGAFRPANNRRFVPTERAA